jgi:hypothetical protein
MAYWCHGHAKNYGNPLRASAFYDLLLMTWSMRVNELVTYLNGHHHVTIDAGSLVRRNPRHTLNGHLHDTIGCWLPNLWRAMKPCGNTSILRSAVVNQILETLITLLQFLTAISVLRLVVDYKVLICTDNIHYIVLVRINMACHICYIYFVLYKHINNNMKQARPWMLANLKIIWQFYAYPVQ